MSNLETILAFQMDAVGLPEYQREFTFHPRRRWRFDFAWPQHKLAVEVEGATWSGGRHTRGSGFQKDCEKYNQAALLGWTVLRYTGGMIQSGEALQDIEWALEERDG